MTRTERYGPGSVIVIGQTVPDDLADLLRTARRDGGLNELLAAARERGWTFVALAEPLGVKFQAIQQRVDKANRAQVVDWFYRVPEAPRRPTPMPRVRRDVPPAIAKELRRRCKVAATVNGATPVDDPRRQESIELAKWLADLRDEGYSYYALAQAIGCTPNAVRFRIGRHGLGPLPPSLQKHVYRGVRNGGPGSAVWLQELAEVAA